MAIATLRYLVILKVKKNPFPTTNKKTKFDAQTNQPTSISDLLFRNYNFGLETV